VQNAARSTRGRLAVFAGIVAACTIAAVVAVVLGIRGNDSEVKGSADARTALSTARSAGRPTVVYLQGGQTRSGSQVALAPAGDPGQAKPTLAPLKCARVYFAAGRGICLARDRSLAAGYKAEVFGSDLRVRHSLDLPGLASRARVSPDGRYGSVTLFVSGDSYAAAGSFSTRTTLIDLADGSRIADLEQFTVTRGGRQVTAVDVNFWGVTFARDGDRFYATMATGGKTYLIEGSVSARTAHTLHENVECPSLSPDGNRIAYKRRTGSSSRPWRLTVLDLRTMRETALAEPRSVDDQAEWLDDGHVLYAIDGSTWSVPADGSGPPSRYIAGAGSPSVVRWESGGR
jgi:WD40-like Beta Propeller Repeat